MRYHFTDSDPPPAADELAGAVDDYVRTVGEQARKMRAAAGRLQHAAGVLKRRASDPALRAVKLSPSKPPPPDRT